MICEKPLLGSLLIALPIRWKLDRWKAKQLDPQLPCTNIWFSTNRPTSKECFNAFWVQNFFQFDWMDKKVFSWVIRVWVNMKIGSQWAKYEIAYSVCKERMRVIRESGRKRLKKNFTCKLHAALFQLRIHSYRLPSYRTLSNRQTDQFPIQQNL